MKVDGEVVPPGAEPPAERQVVAQAAEPPRARRHNHLIEMRVVDDDRGCRRLDDVGEVRAGEAVPQSMHGGRGERDVTNLAETNQQDPRELVIW